MCDLPVVTTGNKTHLSYLSMRFLWAQSNLSLSLSHTQECVGAKMKLNSDPTICAGDLEPLLVPGSTLGPCFKIRAPQDPQNQEDLFS